MINTYKIIESSVTHFKNIEMEQDFSSYNVGDQINVLGMLMNITQIGTEILGCSNQTDVLVFQKLD